jgi:cytochrome c peroxidase
VMGLGLSMGSVLAQSQSQSQSQSQPKLGPNPSPAPATPAVTLESLGEKIFNDRNLSQPAGTACVSCHNPATGFSSLNGSIIGVPIGSTPNSFGIRNAMQNAYSSFVPSFSFRVVGSDVDPKGGLFWDGRADTLLAQAGVPFLSSVEMNNATAAQVVAKVQNSNYAKDMMILFGATIFANTDNAFQSIAQAITAYEKSPALNAFSSKYDQFVKGQVSLSAAEQNGMKLFMDPNKGNCASCHLMNPKSSAPSDNLFTDFAMYATGIPRNSKIPANANPSYFDLGLCGPKRTKPALSSNVPAGVSIEQFCGTFRMPSLRNVAQREFYMHNGVFTSLNDVVSFYATRNSNPTRWYGPAGVPNDLPTAYLTNIVSDRAPFNRKASDGPALTPGEVGDVVAFLRTLSDAPLPKAPVTTNPISPGAVGLNPFAAPAPAPAPTPAPSPAPTPAAPAPLKPPSH